MLVLGLNLQVLFAQPAGTAGGAAAASPAASVALPAPRWVAAPRITGRLRAADVGLVVNSEDGYSVAVGAYYARRRGLDPAQVLHVALPLRGTLSAEEFADLRERIEAHFGAGTQALVLAWAQPYAVDCNSITGALALGFDAALCRNGCAAPARTSPYFNSRSARPWADHLMRPSMLLAARNVAEAQALIDRGVAADGLLARRGAPTAHALMLTTHDAARGVRSLLYPPAGPLGGLPGAGSIDVEVVPAAAMAQARDVLIVQTGSAQVDLAMPPRWLPGALADHLTSFGGRLADPRHQSTVLDWLGSGATASHGTVSEPCNHLQKFPHPQVLLLHYTQGASAIEAYWKSVAWPQQSLFVGEPLAAPFARY